MLTGVYIQGYVQCEDGLITKVGICRHVDIHASTCRVVGIARSAILASKEALGGRTTAMRHGGRPEAPVEVPPLPQGGCGVDVRLVMYVRV